MSRRTTPLAPRITHGSPSAPSLEWESLPLVAPSARRDPRHAGALCFLIGLASGIVISGGLVF